MPRDLLRRAYEHEAVERWLLTEPELEHGVYHAATGKWLHLRAVQVRARRLDHRNCVGLGSSDCSFALSSWCIQARP